MKVASIGLTSVLALKPPLCVNCKFFKKDTDVKFGKCVLFPIVIEEDHYLVTGIKTPVKTGYQYCSVLRKTQCGEEGKLFMPLSPSTPMDP